MREKTGDAGRERRALGIRRYINIEQIKWYTIRLWEVNYVSNAVILCPIRLFAGGFRFPAVESPVRGGSATYKSTCVRVRTEGERYLSLLCIACDLNHPCRIEGFFLGPYYPTYNNLNVVRFFAARLCSRVSHRDEQTLTTNH